jgi:hypothetical protein
VQAATLPESTAQDFGAAFGLGSDARTIGMVDADGIALASIQGLNAKLEAALADRDARIEALASELARSRPRAKPTHARSRNCGTRCNRCMP